MDHDSPTKEICKGINDLAIKGRNKSSGHQEGHSELNRFQKKKDKSRGRDLAHTRQGILGRRPAALITKHGHTHRIPSITQTLAQLI